MFCEHRLYKNRVVCLASYTKFKQSTKHDITICNGTLTESRIRKVQYSVIMTFINEYRYCKVISCYLRIESHFVGVHGPYELHRKEKQIKCTAIHMTREHRQNAIQYLYLHLLTTKFVAILLTLTQKGHISQISNEQKVRH